MKPSEGEKTKIYKEAFSAFDLDGNGTISVEELGIGLGGLGMQRRQASLANMISEVDTDDDQELNFSEFTHLVDSKHLARLFEGEAIQALQRQKSVDGLRDIYGKAPPPETEEGVESGLERIREEIAAIEDGQKEGLARALEECPHLVDDKFLLMFLRTEFFDAGRAAKRLAEYWDQRILVFGETKAFMRLTLDEALADDAAALSLGFLRPTGECDPCGDYSREGKADYEPSSLIRAFWYVMHAVLEDERTQKEGFVFVCKAPDSLAQWNVQTSKAVTGALQHSLPIRMECVHYPHQPWFFNFGMKIVRLFLGNELRKRMRVHAGTNEEVLESMAAYGIPASTIPDIWGGELDYESFSKWHEDRRAIEKGREWEAYTRYLGRTVVTNGWRGM